MNINNNIKYINNNFEIPKEINNDINNNDKKLSNLKRIELINDKLKLNLNKIQKKSEPNQYKKENLIENEIDNNNQNDIHKNTFNLRRNDILSELLSKIQDFKNKKDNYDTLRNNLNSNKILDNLDKEITKGLENLNKKRMNNIQDEKNINDTSNKIEKKILRNPKFKEIIGMINDKETKKFKKYKIFGKNDLLNLAHNKKSNDIFGNINLFSQKKNNINNNFGGINNYGNNLKKIYGNDKFYISCIDGKAIVNGIRKDIPIVSKFNNINDRLNLGGNNNDNLFNDCKISNFTSNKIKNRNNNFNLKTEFTYKERRNKKNLNLNFGNNDLNFNTLKNNFPKENLTNKLSEMNDNYFRGELKFFK